jgi:hypothetical protein
MNTRSDNRRWSLVFLMLLLFMLVPAMQIVAHDHGMTVRHGEFGVRPEREGGESGAIAAWLLAVANFPVVLSLLLRTSARLLPIETELKETLRKINVRQKKHLMFLHYWVNPLAIGVAIFHYLASECKSTAFPELGLAAMFLISVLGIMMALRLSPVFMKKMVFKLHTSPIVLLVVLSILVLGHSMVD